jgi:hypothetical protein
VARQAHYLQLYSVYEHRIPGGDWVSGGNTGNSIQQQHKQKHLLEHAVLNSKRQTAAAVVAAVTAAG